MLHSLIAAAAAHLRRLWVSSNRSCQACISLVARPHYAAYKEVGSDRRARALPARWRPCRPRAQVPAWAEASGSETLQHPAAWSSMCPVWQCNRRHSHMTAAGLQLAVLGSRPSSTYLPSSSRSSLARLAKALAGSLPSLRAAMTSPPACGHMCSGPCRCTPLTAAALTETCTG